MDRDLKPNSLGLLMRYFHDAIPPEQAAAWTAETCEGEEPSSRRSSRRRGATAMEYLFVISLILCAAITGIGYFGQSTTGNLQKSSSAIQNATSGK